MSRLLKLTAIIEVATGLGLMAVPSVVVRLLLGSPLDTSAAAMLGRVAGAALLALGVACWIARDDTQSRATKGLVVAMLMYNLVATAVLAFAGISLGLHGVVLWPAVVVHAVMAIWCIVCLRRSPKM
jgi:hypothetical protein